MMNIENAPWYENKASPGLWFAAIAGFVVHVILAMAAIPARSQSSAEQAGAFIGTVIGAAVWPLVIVGISSIWESNRTQARRVKVFFVASVAFVALRLASTLALAILLPQTR